MVCAYNSMTTINQFLKGHYFTVHRINGDKLKFLEEFSDLERRVMRITFLQLKLDILRGPDNSRITTHVKKKV